MQYSKQGKTHILSEIAFEVKSARKWKTKEQANSIVIATWYQLWSFKQCTIETSFLVWVQYQSRNTKFQLQMGFYRN